MSSTTDQITAPFKNVVNPFNPMQTKGGQVILGNVEVIAFEVLISKIFRWALGLKKRGVLNLVALHAVSQGFLGGLGAPFGKSVNLQAKPGVVQAIKDGAKMVPAVYASQYIIHTANV